MARRRIFRAAARYFSSNVGDTERTSPILSKPYPVSSAGRIVSGGISTASKSRMALLYSARFSRCTAGLPGFSLALRSMVASR